MIGSGYKRLAQIASDAPSEDCDRALKEMEAAYKKAWETSRSTQEDPYPLTNYLVARVIRLLRAGDVDEYKASLDELRGQAAEVARLAEADRISSPADFWATIEGTDAALVGYLVDYLPSGSKDLREELFTALADDYATSWRRYGSARELSSIIEQYVFLAAVLKGIKRHRKLSGFLAKIVSALDEVSG
jgi:hypothetical protein